MDRQEHISQLQHMIGELQSLKRQAIMNKCMIVQLLMAQCNDPVQYTQLSAELEAYRQQLS